MSTNVAIVDAMASQIETQLGSAIPNLQVVARLNFNPTPPSVDIYPAEEFSVADTYGERRLRWSVRCRVTTADNEDGQELLLSMMDSPGASASSLAGAIAYDESLGGTVDRAWVESGPTGFSMFADAGGGGNLVGAVWTVAVMP